MNNSDALAPRVGGAQDRSFQAIFQDPTAVRLMDTPKDLDQGALSRPVLAGQSMNSPGAKAKIHGAQNLNRPEPFGDPAKFNYRIAKLHLGLVSFRFHIQVTSLGS
jgi:hypothetical protein